MLNLLLLLLCLVYQSGSPPLGTTTKSVTGKRGGDVKLSCHFNYINDISNIKLISRSKNVDICQTEDCSGRVFKEGSCDIIIKDLIFSDAGTYFLNIYTNDQKEPETRTYQLHIEDEISVETDEELKMDILWSNANQVVHQINTVWREVWSSSNGVQSDRLTDSDENLIIKEFTANDAGIYRVLDYEGENLITVTVTESKGKLHKTHDDKPKDTEQHSVWFWIGIGLTGLIGVLLVLALIMFVIKG